MSANAVDTTVRKTVHVSCPPARAFELFTSGIAAWWPLCTHSLGEERAVSCAFEARPGGRIYETWDDGSEREWGTVRVCEPPTLLVYDWQPNPDRPAATEVKVRFAADGAGTRVELLHRGWERLGAEGGGVRESYESGWEVVLRGFVEAAV